jgi:hypothetical protein
MHPPGYMPMKKKVITLIPVQRKRNKNKKRVAIRNVSRKKEF